MYSHVFIQKYACIYINHIGYMLGVRELYGFIF